MKSAIRSIICNGPKHHEVRKLQAPCKNFVINGVNKSMLNLMPLLVGN